MITIKLPIKFNDEDNEYITLLRTQQSNIIRYSFNRFKDNINQKEIRNSIKSLNNINELDSWFIQYGIMNAQSIFNKNKDNKVIFGGKFNWKQYINKNIDKEQFKENRLFPLIIDGEASKNGNRKFKLDIENNKIIFKVNKDKHIDINLPKLKKNYKRKLLKLQKLSSNKEIPYSIKLFNDKIFIIFEVNDIVRLKSNLNKRFIKKEVRDKIKDKLDKINLNNHYKSNRLLGIDQNPNNIGLSILEFDNNNNQFKILYKEVIDFSKLNIKSNKSSDNKYTIYLNNKKKFETIEICKHIVNLCKHYKCNKLVIEDLKFKTGSIGKGKSLNRLCKNKWHRELIYNQLIKRCNQENIELVEVNAAYSSFIGNLIYGNENCPDMIASSIEISRRGYKKYEKNWFYPELKSSYLKNQWKKDLDNDDLGSWIKLYNKIKNLKVKYRVSLNKDLKFFRNSSIKSRVNRFIFI